MRCVLGIKIQCVERLVVDVLYWLVSTRLQSLCAYTCENRPSRAGRRKAGATFSLSYTHVYSLLFGFIPSG